MGWLTNHEAVNVTDDQKALYETSDGFLYDFWVIQAVLGAKIEIIDNQIIEFCPGLYLGK